MPRGSASPMITEPSAKQAALTVSPDSGPRKAISAPPAAGPRVEASRSVTPAKPVARSSGRRAWSAASGTMTSFARSPGPRAAPINATSTSSKGNESRSAACRRGTARAAAALIRSVVHEMVRGPARSTSGPVNAFTTTYGAISQKATTPVWVALPVVTSTNQGSAMAETRVPVNDTAIAASTPTSGSDVRRPDMPSESFARLVLDPGILTRSPFRAGCARGGALAVPVVPSGVSGPGTSSSGRIWVIRETRSAPSGASAAVSGPSTR